MSYNQQHLKYVEIGSYRVKIQQEVTKPPEQP